MANDNCKVVSALANIPILFWLPLVVDDAKNEFGRFHANQGLLLFLGYIALGILNAIFSILFIGIPALWWTFSIVCYVAYLLLFVLMIVGICMALTNKMYEFPLIGKLRLIK